MKEPRPERPIFRRTSEERIGTRRRAFVRIKALCVFVAPLALILLTGSAQQTQGSGTVKGQPITTGTTQPGTTGGPSTTGMSSTGTTGTTGTSTTGTSGTDPDGTAIAVGDLRRIEEIKSAPSARLVSTQIVTDPVRHILRLKLRFFNFSDSGTDSHGCQTAMTSRVVAVAVEAPGELAIMPITEGGTTNASPFRGGFQADFHTPYYMGQGPTFDLHNYVVAMGPEADGYWVAYPSIGAAGALAGGTIRIRTFVRTASSVTAAPDAPHGDQAGETVQGVESVLSVDKLLCEAISLDSRKAYGQPNLEGALAGDANADLAPISFKDWIYKGGAFVGNMPGGSGDLSGEGRLQVRYTGALPTTPYIGACLTAFATVRKTVGATPGSSASTATVGLYRPNASDPNLNVGDAVKWGTRWNIQPQTAATDPYDPTKNAWHWFEMTDAMQAQYANWQMPYQSGSGTSQMWDHVALALIQPYGPTWQSFSTAQYAATPGASFPITDSAVRIWRVGQAN